MSRQMSRFASWCVVCAGGAALFFAGSFTTADAKAPESKAGPGEIYFQAKLRAGTSVGAVKCALFTQQGWLKAPVNAMATEAKGGVASCRFLKTRPGTYAVSSFLDVNGNGKLDRGAFGIPTEPWCASRNAKGKAGPPKFQDASFRHGTSLTKQSCQM